MHVSSLAAVGPSADGTGTLVTPDQARPCSQYGESKRQGELAVANSALQQWFVLRPPAVYGDGDAATRLLFRQALAPVCPVPVRPRPLSIVHVRDLVVTLHRALAIFPNRRFAPVEGPDRTDTSDLMRRIAAACGRRARLLPVPSPVARVAAGGADLWSRWRKQPSFFNRDKMREVSARGWVGDGGLCRELLGFTPQVGLDRGLREVAQLEGFASAEGADR